MGGLQKSGLVMVRALKQAGFSVELCLLYPGKSFYAVESDLLIYRPEKQSNNLLLKWVQVFHHVAAAIKKSDCKQVVVFGRYYGAITALGMLFNRRIRLVISERNSPHFRMKKMYESFCELAFLLRSPQLVLSQTEYASNIQQVRYPYSRVVAFPNLFETVRPISAAEGKLVSQEIVFLVAGRFNDSLKGIPVVLEAFFRVNSPLATLKIAGGQLGEDPSIDAIVECYPDAVLRVEFLGKVSNMDALYRNASVFILPSVSEGFPNALVEAMQYGLCCIATEFHAGVFEIVRHREEGIVIGAGDLGEMEDAIRRVISGDLDWKAMGEKAKRKSETFEISNRIKEIQEVFGVS